MSETAIVIENTVEKVENAITIMAEQLGLASDHFYPILVKQQYMEGWVYIGASIPFFIIGTFLVIIGLMDANKNDNSEWGWAVLIGAIFYVIGITIFGVNLMHIINPEYYALMEIKDFIK